MATVNCQTGAQSGTINSGGSFDWTNTSTTGTCEVTGVSGWCTQSSYTVPKATGPNSPGTTSATTLNVTGNYTFSSVCLNPNAPVPRIHIGSK